MGGVTSWLTASADVALAITSPLQVAASSSPVGAEEFTLAHDPKFVAGVLNGRIANGFGTDEPNIHAPLRLFLRRGLAAIDLVDPDGSPVIWLDETNPMDYGAPC